MSNLLFRSQKTSNLLEKKVFSPCFSLLFHFYVSFLFAPSLFIKEQISPPALYKRATVSNLLPLLFKKEQNVDLLFGKEQIAILLFCSQKTSDSLEKKQRANSQPCI